MPSETLASGSNSPPIKRPDQRPMTVPIKNMTTSNDPLMLSPSHRGDILFVIPPKAMREVLTGWSRPVNC